MVLKMLSLHSQSLTFSATPYIGKNLWEEGVQLFGHWLARTFEYDKSHPDFEIARRLNVHRVIADSWLVAAHTLHLIENVTIGHGGGDHAEAFVVVPRKEPLLTVKIDLGELVNFDPWTDRTMDHELPDAIFADYFVDKFYDVFCNEFFLVYQKLRKRPNGKRFQPLSLSEHPRYHSTHKVLTGPPKPEWRRIIDEAANV